MEFVSAAVLLFLIMDPLGNIPIFMSVLKKVPKERRRQVITRELLIALAVMIAFLFLGKSLLNLFGLNEESVSVAGGVVLFLIALRMIFPKPGTNNTQGMPEEEPFIVPLAIPLMAGPSILATIILLTSQTHGQYLKLSLAIITAWTLSACILLIANRVFHLIGTRALIAIERLMGMILVMIAVQMLLQGVKQSLATF